MSLADKIRSSRIIEVNVDGKIFLGRRPTDEEFGEIRENSTAYEVCRKFVNDWRNVKESDLIDGGCDDQVAFDADIFYEYISDNAEIAIEISKKLISEAVDRINRKNKTIKNYAAGSKASKSAA